MNIGFLGTGNMGTPMALNLINAGYSLIAFDRSISALKTVIAAGATCASSVQELARESDTLITMLPAGDDVRSVYEGENGIIKVASRGTLLIDCSTIDIESAQIVANTAKDNGQEILDAPVSGGVAGASAGTLTFMVGGSPEALERSRPLLTIMGKNIFHAGVNGSGQAAKLCNNLMLGISMIATSEAFSLGEKLDLDLETLFKIISSASGSCWAMQNHLPVPGIVDGSPSNNEFQAGFAVAMMAKDLRLAQSAAQTAGVTIPMGSYAAELYTSFEQSGKASLDYSAIINTISKKYL